VAREHIDPPAMPPVKPMPEPPDPRIIPLDRQTPLTHQQVEQVRFGLGDTGPLAQAVMNANVPALAKQLATGAVSCLSSRRPADPVVGQMIYETDTQQTRFWNGTEWQTPANATVVCTSTTKPLNPSLGQFIYCTDTDESLKFVSYGGSNRWMQANPKSNRRLNLNGGMGVWQRGAGPVTTSGQYLADKYQCVNTNSYSRSTDVPTGMGFQYSISYGNSSAAYPLILHKIEAVDSARFVGKYLTISFWAKNVSGSVGIYADFLSPTAVDNWAGVNNWSTAISSAIVPTNSWTYYSFTSNVVAPASVANGLGFYIPRNNGSATTLVTGIQLEVGTAPSEFEFKTYSDELRLCQRYYYTVFNGSGGNNPALFRGNSPNIGNTYFFNFSLPIAPRVATFAIAYPQPSNQIHKPGIRWDTANSISINVTPGNDIRFEFQCVPGVDDGSTYYVCYLYGVSITLTADL